MPAIMPLMERTSPMQAIHTKYIGPTDKRSSRVKATAQAGSVILQWDSALNSDANHKAAARALANKYNWSGTYCGGGLPDGSMAWVCEDDRDSFEVRV
jgi:hypothetical protein